jgi:hypothetical protein
LPSELPNETKYKTIKKLITIARLSCNCCCRLWRVLKLKELMKSKLLKKLRNIGRGMVNIISITKENGVITGMSYSYDYNEYKGLFELGDTEENVKEKAARIYIKTKYDRNCKRKRKIAKCRMWQLFSVCS